VLLLNPMITTLAWALLALAQAPQPPSSPVAHAEAVVRQLTSGDFAGIEAQFNDRTRAALPPGKLATTWSSITGQVGAFQKVTATREETTGPSPREMARSRPSC
jgi:hypothetical protein